MSCGREGCQCGDAAELHGADHECGHPGDSDCCGGEHGAKAVTIERAESTAVAGDQSGEGWR
ncbi:MAG TPA: hypothetical protein VF058_00385 [Actinomycetota bacterium]